MIAFIQVPVTTFENLKLELSSEPINEELEGFAIAAVEDVRKNGVNAIRCYNRDNFSDWEKDLRVSKQDIANAFLQLTDYERGAFLDFANQIRIKAAKQAERCQPWSAKVYDLDVDYAMLPINSVGIYSSPNYPTTVINVTLMARQAGVRRVALATYPKQRVIPRGILAAAFVSGIDDVYVMQGRRAIAAFALGLSENGNIVVPRVDMICGPGGAEVDATKRYVQFKYGTKIDTPAGPSEVVVVAPATYDPHRVVLELTCQCEHGSSSRSFLITDSTEQIPETMRYLSEIVCDLNETKRFYVTEALTRRSRVIIVDSPEEAREICDTIAPEILVIYEDNKDKPNHYLDYIISNPPSSGSICVNFSSALSDYGAETCISPTSGTARYYSKLSVRDFLRQVPILRYNAKGLRNQMWIADQLAELEGFPLHKTAATYRSNGGNRNANN